MASANVSIDSSESLISDNVQDSRRPTITRLRDGSYRLMAATVVNRPADETFAFLADARNLDAITPPFLKFRTTPPVPAVMQEGTVIDYALRIHGFAVEWRSRIENWSPVNGFVDVQVRGPYSSWRHEHTITELGPSRTKIEDVVRYRVPGGRVFHRLFVRRDLLRIFRFRQQRVREIFGDLQRVT